MDTLSSHGRIKHITSWHGCCPHCNGAPKGNTHTGNSKINLTINDSNWRFFFKFHILFKIKLDMTYWKNVTITDKASFIWNQLQGQDFWHWLCILMKKNCNRVVFQFYFWTGWFVCLGLPIAYKWYRTDFSFAYMSKCFWSYLPFNNNSWQHEI